ncbi:hypothetical protein [Chitinophaga ginsengisegetis]|nr:hypothetical protein [Chitinophaga ginsengisegetis]
MSELEMHIAGNKHLPDIPTKAEIIKNGLDAGEMQQKQMREIEETNIVPD